MHCYFCIQNYPNNFLPFPCWRFPPIPISTIPLTSSPYLQKHPNTNTHQPTTQIPYSLTKQEVLGFLGRNAKILTPDIGPPIHIIMDRSTGKTMDCYVEFFSHGDAQAAFHKCLVRGGQLRLGDRVVDVCLGTQDELLGEMFPKAKNVEWSHGRPVVRESTDPYNSGFKAFVTNEELLQLVSYAEKPHRVSSVFSFFFLAFDSLVSVWGSSCVHNFLVFFLEWRECSCGRKKGVLFNGF